MSTATGFQRLDEIVPERRAAILQAAAHPSEPRLLRSIARELRAELPEVAHAAGLPFWTVERTLRGKRSPDAATLAAIRGALGVTSLDVLAARQAAVERR